MQQSDEGPYWGGRNGLKGMGPREAMEGQPLEPGITFGVRQRLSTWGTAPTLTLGDTRQCLETNEGAATGI